MSKINIQFFIEKNLCYSYMIGTFLIFTKFAETLLRSVSSVDCIELTAHDWDNLKSYPSVIHFKITATYYSDCIENRTFSGQWECLTGNLKIKCEKVGKAKSYKDRSFDDAIRLIVEHIA